MKKLVILFLIVTGVQTYGQKLPMYSQYMFNMMNINPAYAGVRNTGTVTVLYRNQWNTFPGAPVTGSVSYDERLKNNSNHGIGVQAYFDRIGIENRTGVQGNYSFKAELKNSTLHVGINAGALSYSADFGRTNPFDLGDPSLTSVRRGILPTVGAGLLYEREKWYVGFSIPTFFKTRIWNIGESRIEKAGKETHYFLTTGYMHRIDDDIVLKPSVLVKLVAGAPLQYDLNMNVWFGEKFALGASYRTGDAILGMAELQLNSRLRFGYAYDHIISEIGNYSRNNHEFMLRFDIENADKTKARKYF